MPLGSRDIDAVPPGIAKASSALAADTAVNQLDAFRDLFLATGAGRFPAPVRNLLVADLPALEDGDQS